MSPKYVGEEVGAASFEPAAFCSQNRRSTKLSYAPEVPPSVGHAVFDGQLLDTQVALVGNRLVRRGLSVGSAGDCLLGRRSRKTGERFNQGGGWFRLRRLVAQEDQDEKS